jgi:peptidoglycan/xylan/chitin deacetylase (PgdA/CDA1 family)
VWIGSMGMKSPGAISRGEFGVVGAARILELLRRLDIPATWFIPGHTIETYPDAVRAVVEHGHEVGHHNYCHENPRSLSPEQERAVLERGMECIRTVTGKAPAGFRSPAWDLTSKTVGFLRELGFLYDSSLMGNDFEPYYCRVGDEVVTDGPFRFGEKVPLVELPVDWSMDDWPYFGLNWNAHHIGLRTPDEVYKIWSAEFDFACGPGAGNVFTLTMHPQIIGRGHRLLMLERLIEYMKGHEGVRFRTMADVAAEWKTAHPLDAKGS